MLKLIQGDSAEVLKTIQSESVDMVITSPPYDDLRTCYNNSFDFLEIANQLYRIVKNGGVVVWIVSDATINGSESGTSFKQALTFKKIGFNIHDTMIWEKPVFKDPGNVRYPNVFEYMFVFSKGKPKTFNPIKDRVNISAGRKMCGTIRNKDGSMRRMSTEGNVINEYGLRFNVWHINPVLSNTERTRHPAQFPLQLATDHIISWSNEDDVILDPFMGSGTTGVACKNTNRNFIGIELKSEYFLMSKNRIEKTQKPLF